MSEKTVQGRFSEKIIVSSRSNKEIKLESVDEYGSYLDDYISFTPDQARELIKAIQSTINEVESKEPLPSLNRLNIGDTFLLDGVEAEVYEYHKVLSTDEIEIYDGYLVKSTKDKNFRTFVSFDELAGIINA